MEGRFIPAAVAADQAQQQQQSARQEALPAAAVLQDAATAATANGVAAPMTNGRDDVVSDVDSTNHAGGHLSPVSSCQSNIGEVGETVRISSSDEGMIMQNGLRQRKGVRVGVAKSDMAPSGGSDPDLAGSKGDMTKAGTAGDSRSFTKQSKKSRMIRRIIASQATFAFSGVWHMLIFYFCTHTVGWRWFWFFTLQAPIIVVETAIIALAKSKQFALPKPVSIFLTNYLLIVVANPLFFGPCDTTGMCTRMMGSVKAGLPPSLQ